MKKSRATTAKKRLLASGLVGLSVAAIAIFFKQWKFAPIGAWDSASIAYLVSVWISVWPMNAEQTKSHSKREDPGRTTADILLIVSSIASLIAVGFLITQATSSSGLLKFFEVSLGLLSVVISWAVVHTNYTLKYAVLYYGDTEGGIDFNEKAPPQYQDFAYLAFTLGMTFQVSDTDIQTKKIRSTVFKHTLLAYLFGTIIIATTINTVASLAK